MGKVRQHNEDACLDRPDMGLWVVADGMGGHSAGDLASGMIVEELGRLQPAPSLSHFLDQVETVLETVNRDLRRLAASREAATIGSTVAALLVRGQHAICVWAGDSRVYRLRAGELEQVTQDHALVADLVDRGVLTAAQAANHPQSNLVTRAVGAGEALKLDCEIVTLRPGDRFILCSDGLDKEVDDREVRDAAARGGDENLADTLVELALSRGSRDNVTVIVVDVQGDAHASEPPAAQEADTEETVPGFTTRRGAPDTTVPGTGADDVTVRGDPRAAPAMAPPMAPPMADEPLPTNGVTEPRSARDPDTAQAPARRQPAAPSQDK